MGHRWAADRPWNMARTHDPGAVATAYMFSCLYFGFVSKPIGKTIEINVITYYACFMASGSCLMAKRGPRAQGRGPLLAMMHEQCAMSR